MPAVQLAGDRPVNLLVISLDTLRRDFVGYHSGRDITPTLDRLMSEGVVLDDHLLGANWTYPSVLSTQTGRNTVDLALHPAVGETVEPYEYTWPTLDEVLLGQGYQSALTSANPFFQPYLGLGRGWSSVSYQAQWPAADALAQSLTQLSTLQATGDPWYLHVHLADPHTPYTADAQYEVGLDVLDPIPYDLESQTGAEELHQAWPSASSEEQALYLAWIEGLYSAELRSLDAELALFLVELETVGALEETLVLVWSDHGEQFFENDHFGHGLNVHDEEGNGVAFYWMSDGGLVPGVYGEPTTQIDLAPTTWDLLGLEIPGQFTGRIAGLADPNRGQLLSHWSKIGTPAMAWKRGDHKLIYRWDGTLELYNRAVDPDEETDIAGDHSKLVAAFWSQLSVEVDKMAAINPNPSPRDPGI